MCAADDKCPGQRISTQEVCYLHLTDDEQDVYLATVRAGRPLELAGLTISKDILKKILSSLTRPTVLGGVATLQMGGGCYCPGATFESTLDLTRAILGNVTMIRTVFKEDLILNQAEITAGSPMDLTQAVCHGKVEASHISVAALHFRGATFTKGLALYGVQVDGDVDLRDTKLPWLWLTDSKMSRLDADRVVFDKIQGYGSQSFCRTDHATITVSASFCDAYLPYETTISGYGGSAPTQLPVLILDGATIGSPEWGGRHLVQGIEGLNLSARNTTIWGRVSFARSTLLTMEMDGLALKRSPNTRPANDDGDGTGEDLFPEAMMDLTSVRFLNGLNLQNVSVQGLLDISVPAGADCSFDAVLHVETLNISSSQFSETRCDVSVEQIATFHRCNFTEGGFVKIDGGQIEFVSCDAAKPLLVTAGNSEKSKSVSMRSLRQTKVNSFILSNISLMCVPLLEAVGVDELRLEGRAPFREEWRRGRTRRQIIHDETLIRSSTSSPNSKLARVIPFRLRHGAMPNANQVAAAYRGLRVGREAAGDAPGSADFYYGEMEMRRLAVNAWSFEYFLLTLYWLVSGYALRAWRTLASLFLVVLISAVLYSDFGVPIHAHRSITNSVLLITQSSLALESAPPSSAAGQFVIIACRILLPGLLALTLLAVRGRVKR